VRARAGYTVVCPPDDEHWHGAAADTFMSHHLTMLEASPAVRTTTTWLEPVPEDLTSIGRPTPRRRHATHRHPPQEEPTMAEWSADDLQRLAATSPYLRPMVGDRARAATMRIAPVSA
jgi:hypothetical protein